MARFSSRGRTRVRVTRKGEYLWVTSQVIATTIATGAQRNDVLLNGADWERGGADSRQTCTLIRTVYDIYVGAVGTAVSFQQPLIVALGVFDEDEAAVAVNALASNGDERWLRTGMLETTALSGTSGTTIETRWYGKENVKQKVWFGNNNELRLSTRNMTSESVLFSMVARVLVCLA